MKTHGGAESCCITSMLRETQDCEKPPDEGLEIRKDACDKGAESIENRGCGCTHRMNHVPEDMRRDREERGGISAQSCSGNPRRASFPWVEFRRVTFMFRETCPFDQIESAGRLPHRGRFGGRASADFPANRPHR